MIDLDTLRDDLTIILRDDPPLLVKRDAGKFHVWINDWQAPHVGDDLLDCFQRLVDEYTSFMCDELDTDALPVFDMIAFCEAIEGLPMRDGYFIALHQCHSQWGARGSCSLYRTRFDGYHDFIQDAFATDYAAAAQRCLDYFVE